MELFTGCGGLAMGVSRAGFKSLRLSEWDTPSVVNVTHNKRRRIKYAPRLADPRGRRPLGRLGDYAGIDLVAGGVPCQPFSIGGRHRGHEDERDMWPEADRAVRLIRPAGFIFENVRGLTRAAFADYLRWIMLSLAMPDVEKSPKEAEGKTLKRLEAALEKDEATYNVELHSVDAANYGAAQRRHRVVILGLHRDLGATLPDLSEDAFSRTAALGPVGDRRILGAARHQAVQGRAGQGGRCGRASVARCRRGADGTAVADGARRHRGPRRPRARQRHRNHVFQPGARSYPGHTGSPLDQPAKALKAGVHGVPGGENMMVKDDGTIRYWVLSSLPLCPITE